MDIFDSYSFDMVDEMLEHQIPERTIDYKGLLNTEQYDVVMHNEGPCLVLAGAGSGKTRAIVHRVARLIEDGVNPEKILLLTFTRKAANEMLERAASILDERCLRIAGGTYHSFAVKTLRKYSKYIGLQNNFTIIDSGEAEDVIDMVRDELGLNTKERLFPKKGTLNAIFGLAVNTCSNIEDVLVSEYPHLRKELQDIELCFDKYKEYKYSHGLLDYDDLLAKLLELLQNKEVASILGQKYEYIMVDEYQDSNMLQFKILKALCSAEIIDEFGFDVSNRNNLMVVGDPNQSIYRFRGAHFRNIVDFPNQFDNVKIIKLNKNYRSVQQILDVSNCIMKGRSDDLYNPLVSDKKNGFKPALLSVPNDRVQSKLVCQKILELVSCGESLNDICVLFRNAHHSADLEIMMNSLNIPFIKVGGRKFLESAHVKDALSYLKVLFNPQDNISWYRVFNIFKNIGLGKKTIHQILEAGEKSSSYEFLIDETLSKKRYSDSLKDLYNMLSLASSRTFEEQLDIVIKYYIPLMKEKYDNERVREEELMSLRDISSQFKDLESFLTEVVLDPPTSSAPGDEDEIEEAVTLSTIHSSKGLEWKNVFIISCIDGMIPSSKSFNKIDELEEEARLFYVAITRAKERLAFIKPMHSFTHKGSELPKLTRFLTESSGIKNLLTIRNIATKAEKR